MIDLTKLVRPLVWDEGQRYGDAQSWLCFNDKGRFCYGVDLAGIFYMQTPDKEEEGFPTIEAAKAAAQADYAARIIAALDQDALAAMLAEAERRVAQIAAGLFPGGYDNNLAKIKAALIDKEPQT